MMPVQISDWRVFQRDGEQFLATATRAHQQRKKAFSPETIYNLTCMGIEKLIMAFLMKNGDLAENHTMGDLSRALEKHLGPQPEVNETLTWLDSYQEICDLRQYTIKKPAADEVTEILASGETIRTLLLPLLRTTVRY